MEATTDWSVRSRSARDRGDVAAPRRRLTDLVEPWPALTVRVALVAIAYLLTAQLGYRLAVPQGVVTLWPPAGIMLALLVLSRRREWPAIIIGGIVGCMLADARRGAPMAFVVEAALANNVESLLAAWAVTRRLGRAPRLASVRAVLTLVVGAVLLSNAVSALLGGAVLHRHTRMSFGEGWLVWWLGDGLGMLVMAPLLMARRELARVRALGPVRWAEGLVMLVVLAALSQTTMGSILHWLPALGLYLLFPVLAWAALRFGPAGAAVASFVVATVALWNAALGFGPFVSAGGTGARVALELYAFIAVAALSSLIWAAVLEERESARRRREESEARYRAVVETARDAILTVDDGGRIRFANPAAERIFGYPRDELAGLRLADVMPPPKGHAAAAAHETPASLAAARDASAGDRPGLRKDGVAIPLEVSFGEIAGGDQPLTVIARDLSEKRAAESALRATEDRMRFALEASRVGTWDVDMTDGSAQWSQTLQALHGIPPGEFGNTYQAFLDLVDARDREGVLAEINRAVRDRTDSHITYRTSWPDGSVHWISGVGRTFYDASGTPVRAAGVGMEITELRALEEQYRQAQKMEAVGQLAGGVAHDFNNVLMAIQGYASLVIESLPAGSPTAADVEEILRAAERGASLTRQLLAFSRKQILAPRVLDLAETLRGVQSMLQRLLGEDVDVSIRGDADAGRVLADPGQIEQVVVNLTVNARDAMPDGGTLLLEVSNVEVDAVYARRHIDVPAGRYLMLAVSDTGVGMDAATLARIFEPFFTTKPQGKGTGLGLATVHGIVKQLGGSIQVYSEPGVGTTFKLYLPRVNDAAESAAAPPDENALRGSGTVLVAEDSAPVRTLVRRLLQDRGYTVLAAATPGEVLELARLHQGRIDLLLTDVVLPEMTGRELAERLTGLRPGLPVLFMSGYTDDAIVRTGVLSRDTPFIQKPFTSAALLRMVQSVLAPVAT